MLFPPPLLFTRWMYCNVGAAALSPLILEDVNMGSRGSTVTPLLLSSSTSDSISQSRLGGLSSFKRELGGMGVGGFAVESFSLDPQGIKRQWKSRVCSVSAQRRRWEDAAGSTATPGPEMGSEKERD